MPDPRATPRRDLTDGPVKTYKIDGADLTYEATVAGGSSHVGKAVMMSGNGVVRLVGDADRVLGRLEQVEPDGACAVRVRGQMTFPKGDGTVAVNRPFVGNLLGAARGYIRQVAAAGGAYAQAAAADAEKGRGVITDVADSAAVEVEL